MHETQIEYILLRGALLSYTLNTMFTLLKVPGSNYSVSLLAPPRMMWSSFCVAKNQPECHYSRRQPMPSRAVTKKPPQPANRGGYIAHDSPPSPPQPADQSSRHTDEADAAQGERHHTATDPQLLPLKRCGGSSAASEGAAVGMCW